MLHLASRTRCSDKPSHLKQHDIEANPDETGVEALGERPGLQTDADRSWLQVLEELHQGLRLGRHLELAVDFTCGIHHTHAAQFQRHVNSGI
jgi:hypothetical protein